MRVSIADRVFAAALCFLGLFVIVAGMDYGLWTDGIPGPGFFPVIAGVMMSGLSACILLRSFFDGHKPAQSIPYSALAAAVGVILVMVAFITLTPVLGMSLSGLLLVIAVGWLSQPVEERNRGFLARLGAVSIGTILGCYLLFRVGLGVPLLTGPWGF
jgi:hypothetical protein